MLEKLQELVRNYMDDDSVVITGGTVMSDLGLNSFDMVELVCEAEEMFDVEIPDRVIATFKTVQDVIDYLES